MKNKIQSSKKTFEKAEYHYCIISINGKPFLETYLAGDLFFYGYTKLYDENGNIKEEGMYSDNSCSLTKKTGVWKYYLDTRIIRIEEYDTKGNLLNAKSF
jgi:hypothetical protein